MSKQDIIYGAMYNGMVYESNHTALSMHWTKEGAEKAIELHKLKIKDEYQESIEYRRNKGDFEYETRYKWDDDQDWCIKEFKIVE